MLLSKFTGEIKEKFTEIASTVGLDVSNLDKMQELVSNQINLIIKDQEAKQTFVAMSSTKK